MKLQEAFKKYLLSEGYNKYKVGGSVSFEKWCETEKIILEAEDKDFLESFNKKFGSDATINMMTSTVEIIGGYLQWVNQELTKYGNNQEDFDKFIIWFWKNNTKLIMLLIDFHPYLGAALEAILRISAENENVAKKIKDLGFEIKIDKTSSKNKPPTPPTAGGDESSFSA